MKDFSRLESIFLILFSGYLLQLINGAKLVINPSGETQMQPLGKGFGLTCQGEASDEEHFSNMKWIGPKGEIVPGDSNFEVTKMEKSSILVLMIKSPTTEDAGMYNCTAVYGNLDELNTAVQLIFYQDITWEDCPEQQALIINSNGKIRCRVSANPPAIISWYRNGLSPTDPRYETENDGIQVTGVTDGDVGEFNVRAMVLLTGKFQTRKITVEVHVPPEIESVEGEAQPIEGTETRIMCQASGFPRPFYSWFDKNQRNLSNVEGYIVDLDAGTLTISNVKREDDGTYTCLAKNPAGEAKDTFTLNVIVKPEIRKFDNVTTVEGESASFECHAYGDPPPEMSIRKDGPDSTFLQSDDRITVNKQKDDEKTVLTLKIDHAVRSDDGLYYCAAENKGAHVEKVGHLTVEFAPLMSSTPIISVKTWNGNPVNLTCIAESIPNATITWSFGGQDIRNNDIYTIYGTSAYSNLLVRPPSEFKAGSSVYGTYKCNAINPHGEQYVNIELYEARPPSVIHEVEILKKTATTITFSFRKPIDDGGLPIRVYMVKFHEENQSPNEAIVHEWSEGTPYILGNLRPRTTYLLQFSARNEAGNGPWSEEQNILIPPEAAPEAPVFIMPGGNISTYPDRIHIRWTEPLDNGKKIDHFELRYFEVQKQDGSWDHKKGTQVEVKKITEWDYAPQYEINHLKPNSYYKVEVRAHNEIGFSLVTSRVFQTAVDPSKRSQGLSPLSLPGSHADQNDGHLSSGGGLSAGAIAAIIIVLVLVILIVLDVTCYVRYEWGILFILRHRVCAKSIVDNKAKEAAVEDGKGGGTETVANNGDIKGEAKKGTATDEKGDSTEKKSKTEVDNPAFDKEKEFLKSKEEAEQDNETEVATEDTPMIQCSGAKDTKTNDNTDEKNKSPKGSKSSIAKDSLV